MAVSILKAVTTLRTYHKAQNFDGRNFDILIKQLKFSYPIKHFKILQYFIGTWWKSLTIHQIVHVKYLNHQISPIKIFGYTLAVHGNNWFS